MASPITGKFASSGNPDSVSPQWGLVADIGGTYGRLALAAPDGSLRDLRKYQCADFASLEGIIGQYKVDLGKQFPAIAAAAFSIAGAINRGDPVKGDWIRMTNLSWEISTEALKASFPLVSIDNDFEAIGKSIPHLGGADISLLDGGRIDPSATRIVCGPGTGFGFCMVASDGRVLPAEAGHGALFSPAGGRMNRVAAVIRHLKKALELTGGKDENAAALALSREVDDIATSLLPAFKTLSEQGALALDPASMARGVALDRLGELAGGSYAGDTKIQNRDVLTGRGLRNIYRALCLIDGHNPALDKDGEQWITRQALAGGNSVADETLSLFWSCLGEASANLAIEANATGGVYIAGGIAHRLLDAFQAKDEWSQKFMSGFRGVGPHNRSNSIPVAFVRLADPALLGLQRNLPLSQVPRINPSATLEKSPSPS
jgi:glucokinase